jgi:hypothetical protein
MRLSGHLGQLESPTHFSVSVDVAHSAVVRNRKTQLISYQKLITSSSGLASDTRA